MNKPILMKTLLTILFLSTLSVYGQNVIPIIKKGGVYHIPCTINGLKMNFVFDTGASDVSISITEALFMLKNGYLKESELVGTEYYRLANGEISEGTKIILKNIEIGNQTIYNVEASIVHNLDAPLLLGQSAIKRLGNYTFNYSNNTISFGKENSDNKIDTINLFKVGNQTWMSENLNAVRFKNGESIFHAETSEEWRYALNNKIPADCYYRNDTSLMNEFGEIYNWYVLIDKRGIAPQGFHIPSYNEWNTLFQNLGGIDLAGEILRTNTNQNNENSFNGLLGGSRNDLGAFIEADEYGHWWSSTSDPNDEKQAKCCYINKSYKNIYWGSFNKGNGYYVRCIKN